MSKSERVPMVVNMDTNFIPIIELLAKESKRDKDDIFNSLLGAGVTTVYSNLKFIIEKKRKEHNGE